MIRMPENSFSDSDLLEIISLEQEFHKLPPRQQAVLGLRLLEYTQVAIANLLHISRTTVWTDEKAALAQLTLASEVSSNAIEEDGGNDA